MAGSSKSAGKSGKRVVMLSRVDQERLANGEISSVEEAVHQALKNSEPRDAVVARRRKGLTKDSQGLSPHDRELLENLPPHFGKL